MVGRESMLTALVERVPVRRRVTIVGIGGVGESTLALEVAKKLLPTFADGAHFVHLAAITNPALLLATVATEIGLTLATESPTASLTAFLEPRRALLVLDNCEHVISAVAELAETLLRGTDRLCILATSREPLGAEDEWQFRLQPLDIPPPERTSAAEARRCGFQMALQDEFRERIETALRLLSLDARRLNPNATPQTSAAPTEQATQDDTPASQSLVNAATLEIEAGRYDLAVRKARQMFKIGPASADLLSERLLAQAAALSIKLRTLGGTEAASVERKTWSTQLSVDNLCNSFVPLTARSLDSNLVESIVAARPRTLSLTFTQRL